MDQKAQALAQLDHWSANGYQAPTPFAVSAPRYAQQPKSNGNFLTHLLPTIGGIGGGVGGGALGGALAGSAVLPGVGTAVGGLLGALLGGGAGGAAGKVAENATEHQALGSGVAGQALEQGALAAGPLRLLKAGSAATKAGTGLLDALGQGGAVDAAASAPSAVRTAIASKLNGSADNLAQRGLKLNGSKFNTDFANRTGEEVGQFARRFNIPKIGADNASQNVLGPGQQAYGNAIDQIGNIPKTDVMKAVQNEAAPYLSSSIPDKQAMGQAIMDKANGVLGNLPANINATDLNGVKSELLSMVNPKLVDTAGTTNNDVLHSVGNAFRKTINGAADNANVPIDTATLGKLGYKSTQVGDLGQELFNLRSFLDQAGVKSRVGMGSNPISLGGLPGGVAGGAVLGGPGAVVGTAASQLANSGIGKKAIASAADTLATKAAGDAVSNPFGAAAIAKRSLPVGLVGALTSGAPGQDQSNSDAMNAQTNMPMTSNSNPMGSVSQNPSDLSSGNQTSSPFDVSNIDATVKNILTSGGTTKDASEYVSLASALNNLKSSAAKSGIGTGIAGDQRLTTQQQKDIASVKNASGLLDAAQEQFQGAGGGKSILGYATHTPVIGQYLNPKIAAYNQTKIDVAVAYAQALAGGGRQPGEAIIKQVADALPSITDSPAQAQQKLNNMRMHLQHREQTVLNYPYTGDQLGATQNTIDQLLADPNAASALGISQ